MCQQDRPKGVTHGVPAQWVGYDIDSTHTHHIYWPETQKVSMEHDIRFTEDTVTVRITPPHSRKPSTLQSWPLSPRPPATIEDVPDEDGQPLFWHDDDGESEVKVEGELQPVMPTPELAPTRRTTLLHAMQPAHQSSCIRKPSAKVRQI